MLKKKFMRFWAEDDEGGGGGSSVAEILGPVGGDAGDPNDEGEGATGGAAPVVPPTPTVDAAELARQFGSVIGQHFKQPVQAQEGPKLSREEAAKLINMWEPNADFSSRLMNLETQGAALAEMRDALIRQADTIAQIRMQEMQQRWEERFNPVSALIEQQTAQQRETRFGEIYPQLANPALRPLLATVVQQLAAGGKLNGDELANFKAIATGVEAVIKATNPDFTLAAKATTTSKPAQGRSGGIPITTPGAGGGGGGGSGDGKAAGVPLAVSFLPKIR